MGLLNHASLFSGIGGFDYAAEKVGWKNEFNCEIDPFCRKVLKKNFKDSIQYEDITNTDFTIWRGKIDIISGGVPCQPFSKAGLQKGRDDERYLWHEYIRAIRECKPKWIVAENVSGLLTTNNGIEYENIVSQLEIEGYETLTILLPASSVGAHHIRERVWIVGRDKMGINTDTETQRLGEIFNKIKKERTQGSTKLFGDILGFHWYETISRIHRKLNGLSRRMDGFRNRALGNAVDPRVVYQIFKTIDDFENVT
jgi:DNA (cytosine-5)-methyltransferase 1